MCILLSLIGHKMDVGDSGKALAQSAGLIESMDDSFSFKNEVVLTQEILARNQELILKIDELEKGGKKLSEEDTAKKGAYTLELHSNVQGLGRLLKEMNEASSS